MSRSRNVRHSMPAELLASNKLTAKRYRFFHPYEQKYRSSASLTGSQIRIYSATPTSNKRSQAESEDSQRSQVSTAKSSQRSSQKNQQEQKKQLPSILEDEQCIEARNKYMGQENPTFEEEDPEFLKVFVEHMKAYTLDCASKEQYEEGNQANILTQNLIEKLHSIKNSYQKSEEEKIEYQKKADAQKEKWKQELDEYDQQTQERLQALEEKQQEEIDKFNNGWDEDTMRKYRKPSGQLLNLWRMEKFLAKQKQFEEAGRIHGEAEKMSAAEQKQAQANVEKDYKMKLDKLEKKHQQEKEKLFKEREAGKNVIITRQSKEEMQLMNRETVVNYKSQEPPRKNSPQKECGTRDLQKKKYSQPSVSFQYPTTLPPLNPPVQQKNKEENNEKKEETEEQKKEQGKNNKSKEKQENNGKQKKSSSSSSSSPSSSAENSPRKTENSSSSSGQELKDEGTTTPEKNSDRK